MMGFSTLRTCKRAIAVWPIFDSASNIMLRRQDSNLRPAGYSIPTSFDMDWTISSSFDSAFWALPRMAGARGGIILSSPSSLCTFPLPLTSEGLAQDSHIPWLGLRLS